MPPAGFEHTVEVHGLFWYVEPVNRTKENTEMCTRLCIYMLVCVCVCMCLCVRVKLHESVYQLDVHFTIFS